MLFLAALLGIILLGGCSAIAHWQIHIATALFSIIFLPKISKYYIFWILVIISFFFAQEPRFSIEDLILTGGFIAWGLSDWWLAKTQKQRKIFLLICFLIIIINHYIEFEFSEHGSLLLWVPIFLGLYFPKPFESNFNTIVHGFFSSTLLFSAKSSALLAYISFFLQKIFSKSKAIAIGILSSALIVIFLFNESSNFLEKSLFARIFIWQSCLEASVKKFFLGYGFGNFAIDFSTLRNINENWGSRADQFVFHGHSVLCHYFFELGIVGVLLLIAFLVLVYQRAKIIFVPLVFIFLIDASLVSLSQFLIASLILAPFLIENSKELPTPLMKFIFGTFSDKNLSRIAVIAALSISLIVQIPSIIGHYYFDHKDYERAIKWDNQNSLYFLMRGFDSLNKDTVQSEADFRNAIRLSPNISFYYGYLAAAELANGKTKKAKKSIDIAIKYSGENAYWHLLAALINQNDKELYRQHMKEAFQQMPNLDEILKDPRIKPNLYVGGKTGDIKVIGFYRKGTDLTIPVPYF